MKDVVVYYYEPVKAPLLREAVLPALREVTTAAHLERGWLRGPHVRIRLSGQSHEVVRAAAALATTLTGYLLRQPSTAAAAELVPPPYEPDNTVLIEAADTTALAGLLGSPAAVEVRAALLRIGLSAVESTLAYLGRHGDAPAARVQAAVAAMTAHAAQSPRGLDSGYLSFRSHLESHLEDTDPHGLVRAEHHRVWQRDADRITAIVAGCADPASREEPAVAWRRWSVAARRIAAAAQDRGELPSASPDEPRDLSEFHEALGRRRFDEETRRQFDVGRFCVNVLYLLLAVCDLTAAEQYLAASLVSEGVERLTGQTWRERAVTPR